MKNIENSVRYWQGCNMGLVNRARFIKLCGLGLSAWAVMCPAVVVAAQPDDTHTLFAINGYAAKDRAGSAVAFAGDVNKDGYGDFVVGMPGHDVPATKGSKAIPGAGRAEVRSGADGMVLMSVEGSTAQAALGTALAANADINGDGFLDVVVGAPGAGNAETGVKRTGSITILYGPAGNQRETIAGTQQGAQFGAAVAMGNMDADDRAEIAVGAPKEDGVEPELADAGSVTVLDDNGTVLRRHVGDAAKDGFGTALAIGLLANDETVRLAVGSPYAAIDGQKDYGKVTVFNAATGAQLGIENGGGYRVFFLRSGQYGLEKSMMSSGVAAPQSFVSCDINGDLFFDLVTADERADSVADGTVNVGSVSSDAFIDWDSLDMDLYRLEGERKEVAFGAAIACGDIDSDDKDDLIVGIPGQDAIVNGKPRRNAGQAAVLSVQNDEYAVLQDVRARVVAGIALADSARVAVEEGYAANGMAGVLAAATAWNTGFDAGSHPDIESITVNGDTGSIDIHFDATALPQLVGGNTIGLMPSIDGMGLMEGADPAAIVWSCAGSSYVYASTQGLPVLMGSVVPRYAPEECR